MGNDYSEYFRELHDRASTAVKVPFRAVTLAGWQPKLNDCHGNAKFWVENKPATTVVRGWLFWRQPNEASQYVFMAHSVLDESGQLVDITPLDPNTPRDGLVFLRHLGTEADFQAMKIACSQVFYPPLTLR
jgi:hypothetical protein